MNRRRSFEGGVLKTAVIFGGLVATLVGGELLAAKPTETSEPTVNYGAQTIVVPQENNPFILELGPIPDVVIPDPITRSQSSR